MTIADPLTGSRVCLRNEDNGYLSLNTGDVVLCIGCMEDPRESSVYMLHFLVASDNGFENGVWRWRAKDPEFQYFLTKDEWDEYHDKLQENYRAIIR